MYTLFTDSDTDITPELAKEYGYKVISMPYTLDGVQTYPYVDFDVFDDKKFYDRLRKGHPLPSTSALSPVEYINYFEPEFAKGNDILYVHFSANMSGTFNSMRLALEELKEKYPERKLYCIDTKGITICALNVVLSVGDLHKQGKSLEEILKWAETEVDKHAVYFYADDLKFFARSGRVSGFSAFFGNMIGIKPIIHMSSEGKMVTLAKGRGSQKSLKMIIDFVKENQDDIKNHRIIVGHADCLHIAEELIKMLKAEFGEDLNIMISPVNPTAGSHCGPNTVGVSFHAKHR